MPHTFGNQTTLVTSSATTITSAEYTPTAGSTLVVLMIFVGGSVDRAGTFTSLPTYAGFRMRQASSTSGATPQEASKEVWYLCGGTLPASGTFVIPNPGALSVSYIAASAVADTGFASAQDNAGGSGSAGAVDPSTNVSANVTNTLAFAVIVNNDDAWAPTGQTGTSIVSQDMGAYGIAAQYLPRSATGVFAIGWTFGTSAPYSITYFLAKEITFPGDHLYGGATTLAMASANPITSATYTPPSGSTAVVLMMIVAGATNRAGGAPTYGGVTMTQANSTQKAAASPEASVELWYVCGTATPSSGTFVIPNTGSLSISYVGSSCKTGAGFTSAFDVAIGSNGTSTTPSSTNMTTTTNGAIVFAAAASGMQTWAPIGYAGAPIFDVDLGAIGGGGQYVFKTTAGNQTMSWSQGTSDDWGAVAVAFKPVAISALEASLSLATATWAVPAMTASLPGGVNVNPLLLAHRRRRI